MKFFLLATLAFAATIYVVSAQHLPEVLIKRAQEIILRAETELRFHHQFGRQHLTGQLMLEIQELKLLERELMGLEQSRHMDILEVHSVEERMLHLENRIAMQLMRIEHGAQREEHEREGEQDKLIGA